MLPSKKQNWLPGIFNDFFGNEWVAKLNNSSPAINIIENDHAFKVEVAAPGLSRDDFKIKVNGDNQLIISMERKGERVDDNSSERYLRREFSYSQFQQTLILPDNVDRENIEASQNNGVLTITLPKRELIETERAKEVVIK